LAWAAGLGACGGDSPAPAVGATASGATSDDVSDGAGPWFEEAARARGLVFDHTTGHTGRYLYPEIACGGGGLFDMDADGDLDAYLVQSGYVLAPPEERPGNQLFANRGDGTFEDVSAGSGAEDRGFGMGIATGDSDGDGDTDLYVTNLGENALLENDGRGRFQDVTAERNAGETRWSSSAAFFDADRDGDLDLFVANYIAWTIESERVCYAPPHGETYCGPLAYDMPLPSTFLRNEGAGTFTNRSSEAGLLGSFGNGLGVGILDVDGDGWLDVFVANDGTKNQMWMNRTDGTFVDRSVPLGCAADQDGQIKAGMGVALGDLDDDADEDLLVVNLTSEHDSLFVNHGTFFADRTATYGLTRTSHRFTRFGVGFHDFDQDGWLDLYEANGRVSHGPESTGPDPFAEPNLLYRLTRTAEGGRFEEVLPRGGTRPELVAASRAAAFGDVDGDGGVDILVVNKDGPAHLLLNRVPARGAWIRFRVVNERGSDALGALLFLRAGEREIVRRVRSDGSYCAANDPRVHVGLGSLTTVDEVLVRWVDGPEEAFGPFEAGREWKLARGAGRAR
jgi:hypothetical protein